ncbi:MAG: winged helix-turn-helix domain-containing protein, partial [Rubrivivax sp.]|nr:winged helix-turn-helix domain-containing protein [Pyrinomonadaceae bacterium]
MSQQSRQVFEFGPFRLDVAERLFLKLGEPVSLAPKTFDILAVLVRENGRLVEKDALLNEVWSDTFVEESSLTQNIYLLRKILKEDGGNGEFIETVPRCGYRFKGEVRESLAGSIRPVVREHSRAGICLEADDNYDDPQELTHPPPVPRRPFRSFALRQLPAALFICLLGAAGLIIVRTRTAENSYRESWQIRSLAVLPFRTIGKNAQEEPLGLGMTDATITRLGAAGRISVKPTSSIFRYADQDFDPLSAGRELGVDAVLDGTVQRSDEGVRVTVRLVRIADGLTLWADKYDERYTEVFKLQDKISDRVSRTLGFNLEGDGRPRSPTPRTQSVEAYEAYARGLFFWNKRSEAGLARALEHFEAATKHDPNYAAAFAGLADTHALIGYFEYKRLLPPEEAYRRAEAEATRAINLDGSVAEAYTARAFVKAYSSGDIQGAESDLTQAILIKPNDDTARLRYALLLLAQGRIDDAIREAHAAREINPLSAVITTNIGYMLYLKRDYAEAEKFCRQALEIDPSSYAAQYHLGLILMQEGKAGE